ncbi:MAG: NnrS family protein [Gammaproteobacteria bacterium]|nr:NnrS family protein [Gammaproteobacteria bacterium]
MSLQIEDPENKSNKNTFALFALGFRPLFLLATFSAFLLIILWILQLSGKITLSTYYSPTGWHAHEMLFGYTVAVIAGFLLTAAGNWTGMKMINGWRLLLLSLIFIFARLTPFISELPHWIITVVDLAFIPLVAFIIAVPVIRAKQWSNFIFVPLLLTMAVANLVVHLSALDIINTSDVMGSRMMLYMVILLIVIMGGRVIPFFTERGVTDVVTKKWNVIERLSPLSVILVATADVIYGNEIITGYFSLFAAIIQFVRLVGWYSNKIWNVPLVWILQLAYSWFIVGFILKASVIFNLNISLFSYHAFTVGGVGIMTLGMMARVSLGHTGREMKLNSWMVLAFILINIAAIMRVIVPVFLPDNYLQLIQLAGWLWVLSFIIFFIIYTPMWLNARVDGREG